MSHIYRHKSCRNHAMFLSGKMRLDSQFNMSRLTQFCFSSKYVLFVRVFRCITGKQDKILIMKMLFYSANDREQMNRDGAVICCLCVFMPGCTAPAICQHSVVTSVEGGTHRLGVCGCVCIREREIERERDFRALYACHISYSCLFLSPVHLYGCDRSHYGFGTASARLANAAFRDGILNALVLHRVRTHTPARITNYCRCPLLQT